MWPQREYYITKNKGGGPGEREKFGDRIVWDGGKKANRNVHFAFAQAKGSQGQSQRWWKRVQKRGENGKKVRVKRMAGNESTR